MSFLWKEGWWWSFVLGMSFSPLQHVRELPEFAYLMSLDRSKWPRCLLWHGWLPGLKGIVHDDPWALSFGDLASFHLERCLGAYPVDFDGAWTPPDYWDAADIALEMPEHPNVWTDGIERISLLLVALRLLVLVFLCLLLHLRLLV